MRGIDDECLTDRTTDLINIIAESSQCPQLNRYLYAFFNPSVLCSGCPSSLLPKPVPSLSRQPSQPVL